MGVGKDSCQKLMDLRMNEKSVCSCHRLFTKLQVSERPKGTDLSLDLQGVTPGGFKGSSKHPRASSCGWDVRCVDRACMIAVA